MSAPATFKQVDLTRALKAALAAGLNVAGYEIAPDGRIIVHTVETTTETTTSNEWDRA